MVGGWFSMDEAQRRTELEEVQRRTELEMMRGEEALAAHIKGLRESERTQVLIDQYRRKYPNLSFKWERQHGIIHILVYGSVRMKKPLITEPMAQFPSELTLTQLRLLDG